MPNYSHLNHFFSQQIVGYAVVIVTFALQAPVRWSAARLHGAPRLLLADVYHFISFIATVNVWRGVWGLLDIYFFPGEIYDYMIMIFFRYLFKVL